MEAGDSSSVMTGASSSSLISTSRSGVSPIPWVLAADTVSVTIWSGASMSLSSWSSVALPVLLVCPAGIVSVPPVSSNSAASGTPFVAVSVTVVGSLDGCDRTAVILAGAACSSRVPPLLRPVRSRLTSGAGSSSSMVSCALTATPSTLNVFVADAVTSGVSSGASVSLSTAVSVTPALPAVSPAGIVITPPSERLKSAGCAVIVTTVSSLDGWESVAVTVVIVFAGVASSSSWMVVSDSASVTVGCSSSFTIVRVSSIPSLGTAIPNSLTSAADTVTSLSGASVSLSTAVSVTVPVLVVANGATVSTRFELGVKSSAAAGLTGVMDTVAVVSASEAWLSVSVTVLSVVLPASSIDAGVSTSVATGSRSSLTIVPVLNRAESVAKVAFTGSSRKNLKVSSSSSTVSSAVCTVLFIEVWPGGKVFSLGEMTVRSSVSAVKVAISTLSMSSTGSAFAP